MRLAPHTDAQEKVPGQLRRDHHHRQREAGLRPHGAPACAPFNNDRRPPCCWPSRTRRTHLRSDTACLHLLVRHAQDHKKLLGGLCLGALHAPQSRDVAALLSPTPSGLAADQTRAADEEPLRRCVYQTDNNVVTPDRADEFEGGIHVSTMWPNVERRAPDQHDPWRARL